jgi:WD40 repeat protein
MNFAFVKHDHLVSAVSYSPDGRFIATVGWDSTARLWDSRTADLVCPALKHGGTVQTAQFRSDGQQFVTASADKSARIWDARTGQQVAEPLRHETGLYEARMSPSGERLVTVSESNTAWLWEVRVLRPLTALRYHTHNPSFVRVSPDGERVVVCWETPGPATISLLGVRSGEVINSASPHGPIETVPDADFSPDGRRFVTASQDYTARVWDAQTGEPTGPVLTADPNAPDTTECELDTAYFSPDGKEVVTASGDGTARVWDLASGTERFRMQHQGRVHCARFSPDGQWIVTASADGTARVWDAKTGQPRFKFQHDDDVFWVACDSSSRRVATGSKDKTARIWSVETGQMLTPPLRHADELQWRHGSTFSCVSFNRDGSRLVTMAGTSAQIWDSATGLAVTPPIRHEQWVRVAQFSPDGTKVLTASEDGTARLWDAATGYPVSEPMRHGAPVRDAQFAPDGLMIITCSTGKDVRIWEVASPPVPVPGWLPELAEALAGQRIDQKEVSQVVPVQDLYQLRQRLKANVETNFYGRWARWFFADSVTRTVSLFSDLTVSEYLKRHIEENTFESLTEVTRLSPTNAVAFARLAQQLVDPNRFPFRRYWKPTIPSDEKGGRERRLLTEDAEWFSRYATNLAPNDLEILRIREAVLGRILVLTNHPAATNAALSVIP